MLDLKIGRSGCPPSPTHGIPYLARVDALTAEGVFKCPHLDGIWRIFDGDSMLYCDCLW